MPCFSNALSRPSTICPFPLHSWCAPDGLPLLLRKQPIWAAGDTHHLMPVEQGLPWHPVATGLAGQAIPFIVAASHAHALPSAPFWFPVPAVLVASPALLCPSSLFAVLALVPPPPSGEFRGHHAIGRPQNRGVIYLPSRGTRMATTLSLIPESAPLTWVLGGGGVRRARTLKNPSKLSPGGSMTHFKGGGQNKNGPIRGPSGYMHAFFVFSKIGIFFCGKRCTKKNRQVV